MRIGVTGIFASGKGTVCELFGELGAEVIDTDIVAREIVEPGSTGLNEIINEFGKGFILEDGTLDRRRFANSIFTDKGKVSRLNSITHPIILRKVLEQSTPGKIYMINTPLLFESGFNDHMEKNIVVIANNDQVIDRGIKRDAITEKEIKERLKYQIPLNEKVKLADYVIDNSGTRENTKRQVEELWNILKEIQAR
ncbi:MAG: dephospho-CoA kinase [bacterium]|nr:dephospho-CoA kinase [bacterium]